MEQSDGKVTARRTRRTRVEAFAKTAGDAHYFEFGNPMLVVNYIMGGPSLHSLRSRG